MKPQNNNRFQQGYACAVSALIQMDRGANTVTKELFNAGLGEYNLRKFRRWGIDEHDISIFKEYRKELI